MIKIEVVPLVICNVCKEYLALPRKLVTPYLQVTLGIFEDVFNLWEPPLPVVQDSLHLCLSHGMFDILVNEISKIIGYDVESVNMAEPKSELGHFVSATEIINGHGRFFVVQTNKENFIHILCSFPIFAHILHQGWDKGFC